MGRKYKPATEVGFLQKMNQKWRACAKGKQGSEYTQLRNTKKEALADFSKAREGAIDSTDVARGLAAVRKQKLAAKIGSLQKIVAGGLAAVRQQQLAAKTGSLQKICHKSQAYANRQLRNTKKEAHADLSKAQEGTTDSTDVVRTLAPVLVKWMHDFGWRLH